MGGDVLSIVLMLLYFSLDIKLVFLEVVVRVHSPYACLHHPQVEDKESEGWGVQDDYENKLAEEVPSRRVVQVAEFTA